MGRFIVLEGGEAAGKSTQARLLAERLGAVLTREPGGTAVGEALRLALLNTGLPRPVPRAEALMMLAARAQHVAEVIEPALAAGNDVVCDRYSGSTLAYQGYGRGLDVSELAELDSWSRAGREPDVVVLLEVPLELARSRHIARLFDVSGLPAKKAGLADRFESEGNEFWERVIAGFGQLASADPVRWRVVNGTGTVEEVAARVRKAVG